MAKRVKNMSIPAIDTKNIPDIVLTDEKIKKDIAEAVEEQRSEENLRAIATGAVKVLQAVMAAAAKSGMA